MARRPLPLPQPRRQQDAAFVLEPAAAVAPLLLCPRLLTRIQQPRQPDRRRRRTGGGADAAARLRTEPARPRPDCHLQCQRPGRAGGAGYLHVFQPEGGTGFRYSFDFNNDGDFLDAGEAQDGASPSASTIFTTRGWHVVRGRIRSADGRFTAYRLRVFVPGALLQLISPSAHTPGSRAARPAPPHPQTTTTSSAGTTFASARPTECTPAYRRSTPTR